MRRRLVFAIFSFLIGLVLMYFSFDFGIVHTLIYLGILALIYTIFFELSIKYFLFIITGCIMMIFAILGHYKAECMPFVLKETICKGYVISENQDKLGKQLYECEVDEIIFNGMSFSKCKYKVRLSCKGMPNRALAGERVRFRAKLKIQDVDEDGINFRRYLYSKGIDYKASCGKIEILNDRGSISKRFLFAVIKWINAKKTSFLSMLNRTSRGYFAGIVFGEKTMMDDDVYEEFQSTGTAHVLAVSGLHIGIIYMIYKSLKKRFNLRGVIDIALIIMLIIYIAIASFSISIMRAVFVILLKLLAEKLRMRFDFLTAIFISLLISLLINPYCIFDIGLQLSFLSALIIAFVFPHIRRCKHSKLLSIIALPLCLAVYNIITFGQLSLIAVLANTPVIFLISIYVPIGVTSFFIYFFLGYFSRILNILSAAIGNFIYIVNHSFSLIQEKALELYYNDKSLLVVFYMVIFFVASEYFYVKVLSRHELKCCMGLALLTIIILSF